MSEAEKKTLLVIDDDPAIRHLIGDALKPSGHEVVLAANPLEAFASRRPADFDLIVTDYDMRALKSNVLAVLEQISDGPGSASGGGVPPIIVVTGYGDHVRLNECARWPSIRGVLDKPFDLADLRRAVAEALGASTTDEQA